MWEVWSGVETGNWKQRRRSKLQGEEEYIFRAGWKRYFWYALGGKEGRDNIYEFPSVVVSFAFYGARSVYGRGEKNREKKKEKKKKIKRRKRNGFFRRILKFTQSSSEEKDVFLIHCANTRICAYVCVRVCNSKTSAPNSNAVWCLPADKKYFFSFVFAYASLHSRASGVCERTTQSIVYLARPSPLHALTHRRTWRNF